MSLKSNINVQIRGFYFAASGSDSFDGKTLERPKLTIQATIDEAAALIPAPEATNIGLVTSSQGGSFSESFVLEDFIQFNGEDTTIIVDASIAVVLASGLRFRLTNVTNSQASAIGLQLDGINLVDLFCQRIETSGESAIAINITGTVDNIFIEQKQLVVSGLGATGINIESTTTTPIDINIDTVQLQANDTIFFDHNPLSSTDVTNVSVSTIESGSFTGTTAFLVQNGELIIPVVGQVTVDTLIDVTASGAKGIISGSNLTGNIIVADGGLLECNIGTLTGNITVGVGAVVKAYIQTHTGTVDNDGTIRGFIGDVAYSDELLFYFKSEVERDDFFSDNLSLLTVDLLCDVKTSNTITTFVWTGEDNPSTYDGELWVESSINVGPGTLFLGNDGASLSSAGKTVNFMSAYGDKAISIGTFFELNGSIKPFEFQFEKEQIFTNADVFDTQLSPGPTQDFSFTAAGTTYTESLNVRPATTGKLRVRGYAGTDNTFPIVEDAIITIEVGDIGNVVPVPITGLLVVPNTDLFLTFTGVDLFGGVQTSGNFSGQTKAFLESVLHVLSTTHFVNQEETDQYILLNRDDISPIAKTGGLVVNTFPTSTVDTYTGATFVAGVEASTNASVPTDGTDIFSADDIVLITTDDSFTAPSLNNGLYEVLTHASNLLTVKGVATSTVEDFTKTDFVSQESTGAIRKVNVSVLRGTPTDFEIGFGSSTPIIFDSLLSGGLVTFLDGSTQSYGATRSGADWHVVSSVFKQAASVSSEDSNPTGLFIGDNERKLFLSGIGGGGEVHEYDLTVSGSFTTLSFVNTFDPSQSNIFDVFVTDDGLTMYTIDAATDVLKEFALATANTTVGASTTPVDSIDTAALGGGALPHGMYFHRDRKRFYTACFSSGLIEQWEMSTVGVLSTTSLIKVSTIVVAGATAVDFKNDGTIMLVMDSSGVITEIKLVEPWEVDTDEASVHGPFDTGKTLARGMRSNPEGTKFYIVDVTNRNVDEFNVGLAIEAPLNIKSATSTGSGNINFIDSSNDLGASLIYDESDASVSLKSEFGDLNLFAPDAEVKIHNITEFTAAGSASIIVRASTGEISIIPSNNGIATYNLLSSGGANRAEFIYDDLNNIVELNAIGVDLKLSSTTGGVGIGTSQPDADLDVTGDLLADSIQSPFGGLGRRQNLLQFSEEFDNAIWTLPSARVTITPDNATAPNGTTTADTAEWTVLGLGIRQVSLGTIDSTTYTLSIWGRLVSGSGNVNFDLHDGTGGIITFDSVMRRHTLTLTSGTGGAFLDFTKFTSVGTFEFWGSQLAEGTEPYPYSRTETDLCELEIGGTISGTLRVNSGDADTEAILELETGGTDGAAAKGFLGGQDPNGAVTGAGGDEYTRADTTTSGSYESREATTGTGWFKRSVLPASVIQINTADEFEVLATAGTITITSDTAIILNIDVVTTTIFSIEGDADLTFSSTNRNNYIYLGTGTAFTLSGDAGAALTVRDMNLIAASTGTWFDVTGGIALDGTGTRVDLYNMLIFGGFLGTFQRGSGIPNGPSFFANDSTIANRLGGFTVSDTFVSMGDIALANFGAGTSSAPFIDVSTTTVQAQPYLFHDFVANFRSGESFIRVDAGLNDASAVTIRGIQADLLDDAGGLFDTSGATGTFTVVADAAVAATAITSVSNVTDDIARFNFTVGPTMFVNQEVVISGFTTNTIYNQTALITATGVGFFEVDYIAFGTTETGSFLSNSVTMTDTGTSLVDGDTINLETDDSTDHFGGAVVYNQLTNTFQVNETFTATQTGTWSQEGLDQTDTLVLADLNPQFSSSKYIATAFVNDNSQSNSTIINNQFTDIDFGTVGTALIAGSTMERWKLINEVTGVFEYTGREPFSGYITFDFTVTSSGGTVDFRFKWERSSNAVVSNSFISFVNSNPDEIFDNANGFLTAGFQADDTIVISGSASNNKTVTAASVTAGKITLIGSDTLVDETSGAAVTLTATFEDLPDNVEALVAVGSDAQSVTKTFPLNAQTGDQIRPRITRNSGSSGITTSYATIYSTQ